MICENKLFKLTEEQKCKSFPARCLWASHVTPQSACNKSVQEKQEKRHKKSHLLMLVWMSDWVKSHAHCPRGWLSRHHEGLIEGPPKLLNTVALWCTGEFQGALNWAPVMPRGARLSKSIRGCVSLATGQIEETYGDGRTELFRQGKINDNIANTIRFDLISHSGMSFNSNFLLALRRIYFLFISKLNGIWLR